jgi:hypothetical protein
VKVFLIAMWNSSGTLPALDADADHFAIDPMTPMWSKYW